MILDIVGHDDHAFQRLDLIKQASLHVWRCALVPSRQVVFDDRDERFQRSGISRSLCSDSPGTSSAHAGISSASAYN